MVCIYTLQFKNVDLMVVQQDGYHQAVKSVRMDICYRTVKNANLVTCLRTVMNAWTDSTKKALTAYLVVRTIILCLQTVRVVLNLSLLLIAGALMVILETIAPNVSFLFN